MPRPKEQIDTSTFSARVAALLAEHGHRVSKATLYAYEHGRANGGNDCPLHLLPALGEAFGYKNVQGWLPTR